MALVKLGLVAIGAQGPGGSYYIQETAQSGVVLLLAALRATIKATLPEIREAPETLFAFETAPASTLLNTPLLAIMGRNPRAIESAVNDNSQCLPFDFVYVDRNVRAGIVDMQAYIRGRLELLQRALLTRYRQGGAANATRLLETPIDHLSAYQKMFADQAQPVVALVLTMEFDIIDPQVTS